MFSWFSSCYVRGKRREPKGVWVQGIQSNFLTSIRIQYKKLFARRSEVILVSLLLHV